MNSQQINQIATKAISHIQSKEYSKSVSYFKQLQYLNIKNFEFKKAEGIAYLNLNEILIAKSCFIQATKLQPNSPDLLNIIADLYKQEGDLEQAINYFKAAIKLTPEVYQFHYNLGLCLKQTKKYKQAISSLKQSLKLNNDFDKAKLSLSLAYKSINEIELAISVIDQISEQPKMAFEIQNLLAELYVLNYQFDKAELIYEGVRKSIDKDSSLFENTGLAYIHTGLLEKSLVIFKQGLEEYPLNKPLHNLYSSIKYEVNHTEPFSNYQKLKSTEITASLANDYIAKLVNNSELAKAKIQLEEYKTNPKLTTQLVESECFLLKSSGEFNELIKLIDQNPTSTPRLTLKAESLLAINDVESAQNIIKQLIQHNPNQQYYYALLSTCLRLTDESAYKELCNYSKLVFNRELIIPKDYKNSEHFNKLLIEAIEELHTTKTKPLGQSLLNGTQTPGYLFDHKNPVLTDLRKALLNTANSVLNDKLFNSVNFSHPINNVSSSSFDFSTAWSVWLNSGGYHKAHVHPKGWYSSAYYVSVPNDMFDETNNDHAGYLGLGKPGIDLPNNINLDHDHFIKPEAGELTLFPSYIWHSTVPFKSHKPRVSVAFDLLPY